MTAYQACQSLDIYFSKETLDANSQREHCELIAKAIMPNKKLKNAYRRL